MTMQLFTQDDLKAVGAKLTEHPGRYQAIHMPGEAGAVSFPMDSYVSPELQAAIKRRTLELAKLAQAIHKVTSDQNLSDQGKTSQRRFIEKDVRAPLSARLEGDAKTIGGVAVLARIAEEELYSPDEIKPGDFSTPLDDREIRAWFAAQTPQELAATVEQMTHRQLIAMLRSPTPLADSMSQIVDAKWEQYLETERASQFKSVQEDKSSAAWAVAAINQLIKATERLAFHDAEAAMQIRPHIEEAA